MSDSPVCGGRCRILCIIDDFTRELSGARGLYIAVQQSRCPETDDALIGLRGSLTGEHISVLLRFFA